MNDAERKMYAEITGIKCDPMGAEPLLGESEGWRYLSFSESHAFWGLGISDHPAIETRNPWHAYASERNWGPHSGNSTHDRHRTKLTVDQLRDFILGEYAKREAAKPAQT